MRRRGDLLLLLSLSSALFLFFVTCFNYMVSTPVSHCVLLSGLTVPLFPLISHSIVSLFLCLSPFPFMLSL